MSIASSMVARSQSAITEDNMQLSLMLQRMPPTFRAFKEHRTSKLTLEEIKVATNLFYLATWISNED